MSHLEPNEMKARYDRRKTENLSRAYDPLLPVNTAFRQEKEFKITKALNRHFAGRPLSDLNILEIGCGDGFNLNQLILLGADPAKITANELLSDRMALARKRLPAAVTFVEGDALQSGIAPESQDIVYQSTVFSSILDTGFRQAMAKRMMQWVKPGGCVLWYDFIVNNPRNPDVRGVPLAEIKALFPRSALVTQSLTLAPPLARRLGAATPWLYGPLNAFAFLRTHVLCAIAKSAGQATP